MHIGLKTLSVVALMALLSIPTAYAKSSCPAGTKPVPETDNCVPVSKVNKKPPTGCGKGMFKVDGRCVRDQDAASSCGPGFHLEGHHCVKGGKAPPPQATLPSWQVEGLRHGCKKGMAWNAQEGCHEND